jgi:hypothetical protein
MLRVLAINTPEILMLSGSLIVLSGSAPTLINIYESVTFIGAQLNNYFSYKSNPADLKDRCTKGEEFGDRTLPLRRLLLCFSVIPIKPCFVTCDDLQNKWWVFLKIFLKVLMHVDTILLFLLS